MCLFCFHMEETSALFSLVGKKKFYIEILLICVRIFLKLLCNFSSFCRLLFGVASESRKVIFKKILFKFMLVNIECIISFRGSIQ